MNKREEYINFLSSKMAISSQTGFDVPMEELTPTLYPHVKDMVRWAVKGGCRAIFAKFGLHKTVTQLEIIRLVVKNKGGKGLIVCPKRVIPEFLQQAKDHMNMDITYVRNMVEVIDCETDIMITNYERVRDGVDGVRIDPTYFTATSLDEAAVLRGYGTKTYQEFLPLFKDVKYRFVATATPAPNKYKEFIHYAGYLGVMDTGQALTRFFKRDSTKANNLTLYEHKEMEFYLWMSTWALFLTKPSDLGHSDEGFELPPLELVEEVVNVDHSTAGVDRDGHVKIIRDAALSLSDAAKERKDGLSGKIERVLEIINRPENINDHFLFWHDLELERTELCKAISGCKAVYGTQDEAEMDEVIDDFRHGRLKYLAAKPIMLGEGINFQHHCHKAIMFIDDKFNDKIQAIHRIYRFMQKHKVIIYFVYTESESVIFQRFITKWHQYNKAVENMANIIREYGLGSTDAHAKLQRWMFVSREEYKSKRFTSVNTDAVLEAYGIPDNSKDLIVTSIPFSDQYEYTPTYNDFGHNDGTGEFFKQMDFLTPELYRVLQPGRIACIHVKDRIRFGGVTGKGFPTLDRFSDKTADHFEKHGFEFFGRVTVVTDVVRENNQTYRLGYTEMCKDASKIGVGCPEYVLLFRKPQTNRSKGYADVPVTKEKNEYSLARWQINAHGFWRSSGDTLIDPSIMSAMDHGQIRYLFREFDKNHVYDYERHVEFAEMLGESLPKDFMLVDPVSKSDMVWGDVVRMRTLNTRQTQTQRQKHVCPLQLDIVNRCIDQYSNKGDEVYDPFGGIGTVGYCALLKGRKAFLTELNYDYYIDGLSYQSEAELDVLSPTLFDLIEAEV